MVRTFSIGTAIVLGAATLIHGPAAAEYRGTRPIYKDAERFDEPGYIAEYGRSQQPAAVRRPPTRVVGDSDYAGSVYGLGKPMSGVGTRPDWGRSNPD